MIYPPRTLFFFLSRPLGFARSGGALTKPHHDSSQKPLRATRYIRVRPGLISVILVNRTHRGVS